MATYRDLIVWQRSIDLVEEVYKQSRSFPVEERYCLTVQMRRSAISVPSNIAEGQGRSTTRDFIHFLTIAYGSLRELETQVIIAGRLGYYEPPTTATLLDRCSEIGRLLNGLCTSLSARLDPPR